MNGDFWLPLYVSIHLTVGGAALVHAICGALRFLEDAAESEAMRLAERPEEHEIVFKKITYSMPEGVGLGIHPEDTERARRPNGSVNFRKLVRLTKKRRNEKRGYDNKGG